MSINYVMWQVSCWRFGIIRKDDDSPRFFSACHDKKLSTTLWFWGFWCSLAPHLVGKHISPGSLAPPISQDRKVYLSNFDLSFVSLPKSNVHSESISWCFEQPPNTPGFFMLPPNIQHPLNTNPPQEKNKNAILTIQNRPQKLQEILEFRIWLGCKRNMSILFARNDSNNITPWSM